jgi:hypothetical protein
VAAEVDFCGAALRLLMTPLYTDNNSESSFAIWCLSVLVARTCYYQ